MLDTPASDAVDVGDVAVVGVDGTCFTSGADAGIALVDGVDGGAGVVVGVGVGVGGVGGGGDGIGSGAIELVDGEATCSSAKLVDGCWRGAPEEPVDGSALPMEPGLIDVVEALEGDVMPE